MAPLAVAEHERERQKDNEVAKQEAADQAKPSSYYEN
jgi:hypothetical protein